MAGANKFRHRKKELEKSQNADIPNFIKIGSLVLAVERALHRRQADAPKIIFICIRRTSNGYFSEKKNRQWFF